MKKVQRISIWVMTTLLIVAATAVAQQPQDATIDPFADSNQNPAAENQAGENQAKQFEAKPPAPIRMARGLRMRADSSVMGQVWYVDQNTLSLHPVAGSVVTFIQNRKVVAQVRSSDTGEFEVKGLTPSATYSVFVNHPKWFAITSAVVFPHQDAKVAGNSRAANSAAGDSVNRLGVLVSTQGGVRTPATLTAATKARLVNQMDDQPATDVLLIQMVPREDFVAALQSGVLGDDPGSSIPGGAGGPGAGGPGGGAGGPGGGAGAGFGGGGPGGGGAGGGGGGALGGGGGGGGGGAAGAVGGLGGAAGALGAIGSSSSSSSSRSRRASPFTP